MRIEGYKIVSFIKEFTPKNMPSWYDLYREYLTEDRKIILVGESTDSKTKSIVRTSRVRDERIEAAESKNVKLYTLNIPFKLKDWTMVTVQTQLGIKVLDMKLPLFYRYVVPILGDIEEVLETVYIGEKFNNVYIIDFDKFADACGKAQLSIIQV